VRSTNVYKQDYPNCAAKSTQFHRMMAAHSYTACTHVFINCIGLVLPIVETWFWIWTKLHAQSNCVEWLFRIFLALLILKCVCFGTPKSKTDSPAIFPDAVSPYRSILPMMVPIDTDGSWLDIPNISKSFASPFHGVMMASPPLFVSFFALYIQTTIEGTGPESGCPVGPREADRGGPWWPVQVCPGD
jgi:hypothetical protein